MAEYPNYFGQRVFVTSTGPVLTFGFDASFLTIRNRSAASIYVNLKGLAASSANDLEIESSGKLESPMSVPVASIALYSSASSSGVAHQVVVAAVGRV